mmetsp:Transcript_48027/g.102915  ORF Transcript_48027/g.102915 Transcript_48027/m.102915 type:complete len:411 (+) Transcript_48027:1416-2648(+)
MGVFGGGAQLPDDDGLFVHLCEHSDRLLLVFRRHNEDHAETAIEGLHQLSKRDLAHCSQPTQDGRQLPRFGLQLCCQVLGQQAAQCHLQAAISWLCGTSQQTSAGQSQHASRIDSRRWHEGLTKAPRGVERRCLAVVQTGGPDHSSHEREAVAVKSRGGEADDDVALLHQVALGKEPVLLCHSNGEADEVESALREDAWQLGHPCREEPAPSLHTSIGDTLHELHGLMSVQFLGGEMVLEEQRLGTAGGDFVDAQGDQVDAKAVCAADSGGNLELRAKIVDAADESAAAIGGLENAALDDILLLSLGGAAAVLLLASSPHKGLETRQSCLGRGVIHTCCSVGELAVIALAVEGPAVGGGAVDGGSDVVSVASMLKGDGAHGDICSLPSLHDGPASGCNGENSAARSHQLL